MSGGGAYTYASEGACISAFSEPTKSQVFHVYIEALRVVWLVCVGFSCLGYLITFVEAQVKLRTEQSSDLGLTQKKVDSSTDEAATEA